MICGPGPKPTLCPAVNGLGKGWPSGIKADGAIFARNEFKERAQAFPARCAIALREGQLQSQKSGCEPSWSATEISSHRFGLAAGGGLLYVFQRHGGCCGNAGPSGGILAYPTDCGMENAACDPVWTWGTGANDGRGVSIQAVEVTADRLYAAGGNGKLYVFSTGTGS